MGCAATVLSKSNQNTIFVCLNVSFKTARGRGVVDDTGKVDAGFWSELVGKC